MLTINILQEYFQNYKQPLFFSEGVKLELYQTIVSLNNPTEKASKNNMGREMLETSIFFFYNNVSYMLKDKFHLILALFDLLHANALKFWEIEKLFID